MTRENVGRDLYAAEVAEFKRRKVQELLSGRVRMQTEHAPVPGPGDLTNPVTFVTEDEEGSVIVERWSLDSANQTYTFDRSEVVEPGSTLLEVCNRLLVR